MDGGREEISMEEKANLLFKTFQQVHIVSNVGTEGMRRERVLVKEGHKLNSMGSLLRSPGLLSVFVSCWMKI